MVKPSVAQYDDADYYNDDSMYYDGNYTSGYNATYGNDWNNTSGCYDGNCSADYPPYSGSYENNYDYEGGFKDPFMRQPLDYEIHLTVVRKGSNNETLMNDVLDITQNEFDDIEFMLNEAGRVLDDVRYE